MRPWLLGLGFSACCFVPNASWCADECRREGACQVRTHHAGDGIHRCYAASDTDCAGSERCARTGACYAADDGLCVRAEDVAGHRCTALPACRARGACHPRDGICEPTSEVDCMNTLQCLTEGRCRFDASRNFCYPSPEDCARSTGCALEGICTLEGDPFGGPGHCALTSFGSCEGTLACTRDGRCAPRPVDGCSPGCRLLYCGYATSTSTPRPCTEQGGMEPACEPDGRCMRNAAGACEHVF